MAQSISANRSGVGFESWRQSRNVGGGHCEMDVLGEMLRAIRLSACTFLEAEFTAPWCVASRLTPEDWPFRISAPAHMIAYHYVVEGEFLLQIPQQQPVFARRGHLLLLPRNDAHVLTSTAGLDPIDNSNLIEFDADDGIGRLRHGGGGSRSHLLCGYLGTEDASDPLLMHLPALVHLDLSETSTAAWVEGSIRHAMRGSTAGDQAATSNLTKLAEVLFGEAIRAYLKDLPEDQRGWITGLREPVIAKALVLIHSRLDHPWTLEGLARAVGASRSKLTDRFMYAMRVSPMQYVRRRRLCRAADELSGNCRSIAEVGFAAGYDSEAAFSRAFKRQFGASPSAFRAGDGSAPMN